MAHYTNTIHPGAVPPGQAYALSYGSAPQRPAFNSPTRRRVPLQPYTPTQGWKVAMARTHEIHHPVSFDYPGQARQGVSMRELRLKGMSVPLHGANDPVLAHTGLQRVILRIIWPGYGHVEWCRTVPVVAPNGAPITRLALGVQIANNFARFIEKCQSETPSSRDLMFAANCVRFEHLFLLSLQNTFEDVWQADVALDL
ncbi:hypothetical protein DFH06DRAFT_1105121 [Mycena polygramma]|nr:hypothetical protein DFH06DRAFT_1105121 [Mycena polygramma]